MHGVQQLMDVLDYDGVDSPCAVNLCCATATLRCCVILEIRARACVNSLTLCDSSVWTACLGVSLVERLKLDSFHFSTRMLR